MANPLSNWLSTVSPVLFGEQTGWRAVPVCLGVRAGVDELLQKMSGATALDVSGAAGGLKRTREDRGVDRLPASHGPGHHVGEQRVGLGGDRLGDVRKETLN